MGVRHWAIVPAAGIGSRMGASLPKQYLPLAGRSVLDHSIERLLRHPLIDGLCVALRPDDPYWADSRYAHHPDLLTVTGGAERCHSVMQALDALAGRARDGDWVLVHDAARPCVRGEDITRLIDTLTAAGLGGLLGMRVRDTMKRSDGRGLVQATLDRSNLWHAFTPQMFRFAELRAALASALEAGELPTDEASAMERAGHGVLLVEGAADNIKITRPEDLALAEYFLAAQQR